MDPTYKSRLNSSSPTWLLPSLSLSLSLHPLLDSLRAPFLYERASLSWAWGLHLSDAGLEAQAAWISTWIGGTQLR